MRIFVILVMLLSIILFEASKEMDQEERCNVAVRRYLASVYPAARDSLQVATNEQVQSLFESLEYYYFCSRRRSYLVDPRCEFYDVSRCEHLPYLPPGTYYYVDSRSARYPQEMTAKKWYAMGSFHRWQRPLKLLHEPKNLPRIIDFSSKAQRLGPAPSWTNPLAIVKYPLFPLGLEAINVTRRNDNLVTESNEENSLKKKKKHLRAYKTNQTIYTRKDRPVRPLFAGDVYGLEALVEPLELTRIGNDFYIEIEQFGGPVWIRDCGAQAIKRNAYAVCGLWANVWKGTGIFLRVDARFTFRSASKATAIVELLLKIEARESAHAKSSRSHKNRKRKRKYLNYPILIAIAQHMRVYDSWLQELAAYPSASPASALIATLYVGAGVEVCSQADHYDDLKMYVLKEQAWLRRRTVASSSRNDGTAQKFQQRTIITPTNITAVHPHYIVDWLTHGPKHTQHTLHSRDLAADWLFSICGYGGYFRDPHAPNRPYTGWDGLLMVLSCLLGIRTLLFEASSNDNGLYHHELVDFDFPGIWPSSAQDHDFLNPLTQCLPPIPDHENSDQIVAELEYYWRQTDKFVLRDPLTNHDHWQPCDLINTTWVESPSRCRSTKIRHMERMGHRPRSEEIQHNCYLSCRGAMSQSHSLITDIHMSHPERSEFIRRRMRLFRKHRARGWSSSSRFDEEDEGSDIPDSIPEEDYIDDDTQICELHPEETGG
uniref:Uncharacterized protein n=1 Tax=Aureoumbra lagunensis TaxID=44058 RepID=A0A7S3NR66_9STRA